MGWDGRLFMASLMGLLGCRILAEFTRFGALATWLAWLCAAALVVAILVCWFRPRHTKECDHYDHHD
jgi:uncharacterized membrane protein YobD (UPF0266 family)